MDLSKYPRVQRLMQEKHFNLDQAHEYVKQECEKRGILEGRQVECNMSESS